MCWMHITVKDQKCRWQNGNFKGTFEQIFSLPAFPSEQMLWILTSAPVVPINRLSAFCGTMLSEMV